MVQVTRREFLKTSTVAAGALGIETGASAWTWSLEDPSTRVTEFFVAIDGSDEWSGRFANPNGGRTDGPFRSLERARDAMRAWKDRKDFADGVAVTVRQGRYFLDRTFELGEKDSGAPGHPVVFRTMAQEKAVLSGGRKVEGWKPYKGKILQADLAQSKGGEWKFRQLFLNGEPQRRSRYPKFVAEDPLYGGWLFAEGPAVPGSTASFRYKEGAIPRNWARPEIGEVVVFPGGGWVDATLPIQSLDEGTRTITATHRYRDPDVPPWFVPDSFQPGDRFRIENLLEELTEPGEWCLDFEEGVLYFWPPKGTLQSSDEVVAPVLRTLVSIERASWIGLSGFTFTETQGGDDLHRFGLDGYGAMYPDQGLTYCGEALLLRDAEHCSIEENHFYALGGNAIYLERFNARNRIRRNTIDNVGANGISLLGNYIPVNSVSEPSRRPPGPLPIGNEITDNFIHHCGVLNKYVAGVFLGVSDSNVVAHNRIEYLPHHAINLGMNGYGRNILEYNEIRNVCLEIRDNGGINCWMDDPQSDIKAGHIIRFNLLIDIPGCHTDHEGHIIVPDGMANGIYLDNNSSNCTVHGNIIVRCSGYGMLIHGGQHNLIENNIIVDAAATSKVPCVFGCGQVAFAGYVQPAYLIANRLCNNILSFKESAAGGPQAIVCINPWDDANKHVSDAVDALSQAERNVYHRTDGGEYVFITGQHRTHTATREVVSWAEWRALGFDGESELADPMFVDAAHDDYRLRPESPALRSGFVPIDVNSIGIRMQR